MPRAKTRYYRKLSDTFTGWSSGTGKKYDFTARGSVGTKTYGKISLRSGHFSSKLRYVKKLSDFHILVNIQRKISLIYRIDYFCSQFLAIYRSESCKSPDNSANLVKNVA